MDNLILLEKVKKRLLQKKLTVSVAESCTGGLLSAALTELPGSSEFFLGGLCSYANMIKSKLLCVDESELVSYGAVSEKVVVSMLEGSCHLFESDCSLAVSGIAGPTGGSLEKPVGTVYMGFSCQGFIKVQRYFLKGSRAQVRKQAVASCLSIFSDFLENS